SGTFFLLLETEDAERDECLFAVGKRDGHKVHVTEIGDLDEFVSMAVFPAAGFEGALACTMSADGTLLFSDGKRAWSELVVPESFNADGTRNRRRMRTINFVDGALVATGFHGQVYRRHAEQPWEEISFTHPDLVGGHAVFYHAITSSEGNLACAGIFAHSRELSDELKAASAAKDAKLFRAIKRAQKKSDHILVAEFRQEWTILYTDLPGVASWFRRRPNGGYYLVSASGIVWQTEDFLDLELLSQPETPQGFDDIELWHGEPVFFQNEKLLSLGEEGLETFEPPLPDDALPGLSLWSTENALLFAQKDALWILDSDAWVRLDLVRA
ncbi:MAG: hypothetical protein AAGK71_11655, partial [Pseudomonadota bacterium]